MGFSVCVCAYTPRCILSPPQSSLLPLFYSGHHSLQLRSHNQTPEENVRPGGVRTHTQEPHESCSGVQQESTQYELKMFQFSGKLLKLGINIFVNIWNKLTGHEKSFVN